MSTYADVLISIHAPREGSDLLHERTGYRALYFYPRSPRGERRLYSRVRQGLHRISIHAPREGSDKTRQTM